MLKVKIINHNKSKCIGEKKKLMTGLLSVKQITERVGNRWENESAFSNLNKSLSSVRLQFVLTIQPSFIFTAD